MSLLSLENTYVSSLSDSNIAVGTTLMVGQQRFEKLAASLVLIVQTANRG